MRGRARRFHRSTWLDGVVAGLGAAAFSPAVAAWAAAHAPAAMVDVVEA